MGDCGPLGQSHFILTLALKASYLARYSGAWVLVLGLRGLGGGLVGEIQGEKQGGRFHKEGVPYTACLPPPSLNLALPPSRSFSQDAIASKHHLSDTSTHHVGVKAPGTPKSTTFLPDPNKSVPVTSVALPSLRILNLIWSRGRD